MLGVLHRGETSFVGLILNFVGQQFEFAMFCVAVEFCRSYYSTYYSASCIPMSFDVLHAVYSFVW
jgi:hypothetical protein